MRKVCELTAAQTTFLLDFRFLSFDIKPVINVRELMPTNSVFIRRMKRKAIAGYESHFQC